MTLVTQHIWAGAMKLPKYFTCVSDPRFIIAIAYASDENLVGRRINGYDSDCLILTEQATSALSKVQDELDAMNSDLHLKIHDGYRPQRASNDFISWCKTDDQKNKMIYYPDLDKKSLFQLGYIASTHSAHSRGSTIDLTIVQLDSQGKPQELDMGTRIDYLDEASHSNSNMVSEQAQQNRRLLKSLMEKHGFNYYWKEWWHFTLANEPYPNTYFDFPISAHLCAK